MKKSKKAKQNSKQNSVPTKLGSEQDEYSTSLNKLTDNFAYLQNRAKLDLKKENRNLLTLSGISKTIFETLTAVSNG